MRGGGLKEQPVKGINKDRFVLMHLRKPVVKKEQTTEGGTTPSGIVGGTQIVRDRFVSRK